MPKKINTIVKGSGIIFVGFILIAISDFLLRLLLARSLGPTGYGTIYLAITILSFATLFSLFGLDSSVTRFVAKYNALHNKNLVRSSIKSCLEISLFCSIISSIIIFLNVEFIALTLFNEESLIPVLRIFCFIVPFATLTRILRSTFHGFNNTFYDVVINVGIVKILLLAILGGIVFFEGSIVEISYAYLIVYMLSSLFGFVFLEYKIFPFFRSKLKNISNYLNMLNFGFPLLLSGFFGLVLSWSDNLIIGFFLTTAKIGVYNVAFPIAQLCLLFHKSFRPLIFSTSSEHYGKNDLESMSKIFKTTRRWTILSTTLVFLLLLLIGEDLIRILFGQNYEGAFLLTLLLSLAFLIVASIGNVDPILRSFGKTRIIFYVNLIAAMINIILDIILIPIYDLIGVVVATGIAFILRQVLIFCYVRRLVNTSYEINTIFKYALAALITYIVIFSLRYLFPLVNLVSIILLALFGMLIYCLFVLYLKAIKKEDLTLLYDTLRKFNLPVDKRVISFLEKFIN